MRRGCGWAFAGSAATILALVVLFAMAQACTPSAAVDIDPDDYDRVYVACMERSGWQASTLEDGDRLFDVGNTNDPDWSATATRFKADAARCDSTAVAELSG